MSEIHKKVLVIIYFTIAVIISAYASLYRLTFFSFLKAFISTLLCFVGIYICLQKSKKNNWQLIIIKVIGILIFLVLISATWISSSLSGFHSGFCYNLVGENILTSSIKIYCNYPPWYTKIIGGEEARKILLEDCKNRRSQFYSQNPDYCNIYEEGVSNKNWSIGPNP